MALKTNVYTGDKKETAEATPEGYEFVTDEKGNLSIKKIRNGVKKAEVSVEEEATVEEPVKKKKK